MVFTIQLVLILTSSVCESTFVVNVAKSFYQAEENHNVTLEWTFTAQPSSSNKTLFIYCEHLTHKRPVMVFEISQGVEASLYQDKQFVGRVQIDKDALRNGRIRLHLSGVTTEDSGVYKCKVKTEHGQGFDSCQLYVTKAAHEAQTQGPAVRSPPSSGKQGVDGQTALVICFTGFAFFLLFGFVGCVASRSLSYYRKNKERHEVNRAILRHLLFMSNTMTIITWSNTAEPNECFT
ncbi:uncharacterized protein ACNS7B_021519 isoform 1-T2 [Menidia menidia]